MNTLVLLKMFDIESKLFVSQLYSQLFALCSYWSHILEALIVVTTVENLQSALQHDFLQQAFATPWGLINS